LGRGIYIHSLIFSYSGVANAGNQKSDTYSRRSHIFKPSIRDLASMESSSQKACKQGGKGLVIYLRK
jgi:hypothetical protein